MKSKRRDSARDQRIMEEARKIKKLHPEKPMKMCLLEAIAKEQKKEKLSPIFR